MSLSVSQARSVTCRYCREEFTSRPGKPGYVDECPDCLYDRTVPQLPAEQRALAWLMGESKEMRKGLTQLRRFLLGIGIEEARVDRIILDMVEKPRDQTKKSEGAA